VLEVAGCIRPPDDAFLVGADVIDHDPDLRLGVRRRVLHELHGRAGVAGVLVGIGADRNRPFGAGRVLLDPRQVAALERRG
jgi:hypothetical protein